MRIKSILLLIFIIGLSKSKDLEKREHSSHLRNERAIGSLLGKLTSLLLWTTNAGLTIAEIASGGCSSFPSICRDRDEIKRLQNEIQHKKTRFEALFSDNGRRYVDLKQTDLNNRYVSLYVNNTIKAIDRIVELSNMYVENITVDSFTSYSREADDNSVAVTREKYLGHVVGQLEASLHSIKEISLQDPDNQLLGLTVQIFVESVLNRFMRLFSEVYGANKGDDFYQVYYENMFNAGGDGNQNDVQAFNDMHLISNVFKIIGTRIIKYLPNGWMSLKYWSNMNSWGMVKKDFVHIIQDPIQNIDFDRNFKSLHRDKEVNGIPWAKIITGNLRTIGRAIKAAIVIENWRKVASEVARARKEYEDYNNKLSVEIKTQEDLQTTISDGWETTKQTYKSRVEMFRNLLVQLNGQNDFSQIFGLTKQLTDKMFDYIPQNLNDITTQNIMSSQERLTGYIQNMYNGLVNIQNTLNVRIIMYSNIHVYGEKRKTVSFIFQALKNVFKYRTDNEKIFGTALVENDVVCAIAILFPLKTEYDFYTLQPYRPTCDVNPAVTAEAQKKRERSLLITVVTTMINQESEVTLKNVYDSVKNAYQYSSNENLRSFGVTITERDVVCVVAMEFPSTLIFDFIPLTPFRPTCDAVSETEFSEMKKKQLITMKVKSAMDICDTYSHCLCIPNISSMIRETAGIALTDNDVKIAISQLKPDLPKYYGTTGCACVNLS